MPVVSTLVTQKRTVTSGTLLSSPGRGARGRTGRCSAVDTGTDYGMPTCPTRRHTARAAVQVSHRKAGHPSHERACAESRGGPAPLAPGGHRDAPSTLDGRDDHDRGHRSHQALRRQDCRRRPDVHRPARGGHRLPRPERRREVDDHADDPRSGRARPPGRSASTARRTASTPRRCSEVGALLEARSVHTGRSAFNHLLALAQTAGIPGAGSTRSSSWSGLGEVARKRAGGFSLGMGQRLGHRLGPARRPAHPDPRRAGQRPGPRRHPLDPQPAEVSWPPRAARSSSPRT